MSLQGQGEIFCSLSEKGKQPGSVWNLDDFAYIEKIGIGATSKIFLCEENASGVRCVIKCISKSVKKEVIQNEIEIHKKFCHENIVRLYGYFILNNRYYLLIEYGGKEMFELICDELNKKSKLDDIFIKKIFKMMVAAINECHLNGVIHSDVKLENFVYDSATGILKLIDFGFAAIGNRSNIQAGTLMYMAPELYNLSHGEIYDSSVDIWALGCMLYILFNGFPPFTEKMLEFNNIHRYVSDIKKKMLDKYDKSITDFMFSMLEIKSYMRPPIGIIMKNGYFSD